MKKIIGIIFLVIIFAMPINATAEITLKKSSGTYNAGSFGYSTDEKGFIKSTTRNSITYTLLAPFTSTGIGSNSYDFNGTSHYVSVPDDAAYSSSAITVFGWANPDTISGSDDIITKEAAGQYEVDFFLNAGAPTFRLFNADGTIYIGRSSPALTAGKWTFLMAVARVTGGTAVVGDFDILQNCVAVDSADSTAGVWAGVTNGTASVAIGAEITPSNYFDGKLMNVGFANADLTSLCESIMAASSYATYTGSTANLVAWWDLQSDVEDKHSTYEGTAQGGVAPASPSAYPFKDSSNPVLLANDQTIDTAPPIWGVTTGSLNIVDTSTGTVSLTGTKATLVGTAAAGATHLTSGAITRANAIGLPLLVTNSFATSTQLKTGFHSTNSLNDNLNFDNGGLYIGLNIYTTTSHQVGGSPVNGTDYKTATIIGANDTNGIPFYTGQTLLNFPRGTASFVNGGVYTNWTLVWRENASSTATIYPIIKNVTTTAGSYDNIKIPTTAISSAIFQPYALDTFTDANATVLTAHTMDVGTGWTKRVADSVFDIDTNSAELETDGSDPLILPVTARYAYIPTVADGITDLTVKCDSTLNAQNGLLFRGKADGAIGMNGWAYVLQGDATNCDEYVYLYNNDGGTAIYSNAAGTLTNGTSYALRVQHIGDTIRTYRAGVKIGSDISNATNNDGTWAGIFADTTSNTNTAFDTFSVFGAFTNGNGTAYSTFFSPYGY